MSLLLLKCCINPTVISIASNLKTEPIRKSANYHPCIWGNQFATYTPNYSELESWSMKAEKLKRETRMKLQNLNVKSTADLVFLDDLQRLGLGYHFEEEIEEILHQLNKPDSLFEEDDLFSISLRFYLLRQGGFHAPSDVFDEFVRDKIGGFKEQQYSISDTKSLLYLYESSALCIPGEAVMDEVEKFGKKHLQLLIPHLDQHMKTRVQRSLTLPPYKSFRLWEFRNFITFYQQDNNRSNLLLEFAKLDFNLVQSSLKTELKDLTTWWNELGIASKIPSSSLRNRLVELFLWSLYIYHEPHHRRARTMYAKMFVMTSVSDDIYDVYGTMDELELLTDAFNGWSREATSKMPEYMQTYYRGFLDLFDYYEKELSHEGYAYRIDYLKEGWKAWAKAYLTEAKWSSSGYRPSVEEYMSVARFTVGFPALAILAVLGMGDVVTIEALEWLYNWPSIVVTCANFCRKLDDLQEPYKFEYGRNHVDSCVDCYMRENGVSGPEAKSALRKEADLHWKEINRLLLRPRPFPFDTVMAMLNLARSGEVYYLLGDNYGDSTGITKDIITTLLIDHLPV